MNAPILRIQHFSIHDGPGIRTVVFLKGCCLSCLWCHNPESWSPDAELSFSEEKCVCCGACMRACPRHCHVLRDGAHEIDRDRCIRCGACTEVCCGALEWLGKTLSADEVLREVLKDAPFYEKSGGGLTLSGGEPLLHTAFCRELLSAAKAHGLHTAIETSGFADWTRMEAVLPYLDLFLYDLKETHPALHEKYTGVSNELIRDNLFRLDRAGKRLILRCPIIPGLNDRPDHFSGIAAVANQLQCLERIDIEPYHPLGRDKARKVGRSYALPELGFPEESAVAAWVAALQHQVKIPVRRADL